ncbi:DUF5009 domain-containing protein [Alistipes sp. UBA1686]|uniref:DUF5009 domain-containing protein n=1 Tax=Alistipes sp. UBA1686 TaxID=1946007 RepID=UPI00257C523F|nr:DUF5009 domain-containing protein [Alistipes sp. UBA1686]
MNNRAYAVDILRGLAIVGMVLSGYIAWNPDLPAWLFHAQLPPPSFVFDASVAGITWVDLVFPFFLFSMGAAFPLSLGRRLNRGTRPGGSSSRSSNGACCSPFSPLRSATRGCGRSTPCCSVPS